jgi:sulfur carrier protein
VKYVLNGESQETPAPSACSTCSAFDLRRQRVAVAINAEVVPKSRFAEVFVRDGDKVEVIHAVGGGA